ncbi:signal transduction histidine kinase [Tahibacter aquaticus]|uniref:histidine kinase n=1 Tax=Tahibacter aquaticus TaxID=520092 RepID=A0A4R6Z0C9_9GAMM|nr:response regulator [Tahibacter aquaticus]TDR44983.1 signal transduction histidine kinase [Tahibacter aquaticus]
MNSSNKPEDLRGLRSLGFLPLNVGIGYVVAVLAVVLIAWFSYASLANRTVTSERAAATGALLEQLRQVVSTLKDAETGQRGYLLTGDANYLMPFTLARAGLASELDKLRRQLPADDLQNKGRVETLAQLAGEKLDELGETIALREAGNLESAMSLVRSDRGRITMDRLRAAADEIEQALAPVLAEQQRQWKSAADRSMFVSLAGSGLLFALILLAAYMTSRDYHARETEAWLRNGHAGFGESLLGEQSLQSLGDNALNFVSRYLEAPVGLIYVTQGGNRLELVSAHATSGNSAAAERRADEGLIAQASKDQRLLHVRDVPAGYLTIGSGSGQADAVELLILPAVVDGRVHGIIELGFFRRVKAAEIEFLRRVSELFGVVLRTAKDRARVQELLEETQQQAEELQTQQEELRVNNEELEEQGSALRASRTQLENQQAELEQSNSQLEEFAQQLEHQRDELARSQVVLIEKAAELERVNSYKSEFLANMSHELRTPLNSTLILARLLADNKPGTLTPEQVKFAETISSAGKDLLSIINDILDLAKIESGKVELNREAVNIAAATDALTRSFRPVAEEKGLKFSCDIEIGTPTELFTDPLRLGQVLRNLLSNALKFTERGEVGLRVSVDDAGHIQFIVQDTGIGIAEAQQDVIFEAFRQADGSMHRKYGGTGLGLSISRDLARLLGGDIAVRSTPGKGSIFQLTLPLNPAEAERGTAAPVRPILPAEEPPRRAARELPLAPSAIEDDRERISEGGRCVLVIEDDPHFAEVLRDVAREMGFACVVTQLAGDGLAAATRFRPLAILLDINLPDQSGLGVLDQLKSDSRTRHIPVHVLSVADYSKQALERGAVGYAVKPVLRAQLVEALRQMEAKGAARVRNVLVVEDNPVQLDSIRLLLAADDVEIVGVDSAGAALLALQSTTFDCMVLDLNLPDMSGYALLEKMAERDEVAFPPVIVYTGRALNRNEEQSLRRFSRSIIIKDARSPERLLDEVTLFLHQMESTLPPDRQRMLKAARDRDAVLEGRRILVVEDDVRNIFAVSSVLEPKGAKIEIARNGREALEALNKAAASPDDAIDLVLMDIMMPEMDGFTAMREIRRRAEWRKLPIIALTAKAMKDDQEKCLAAGANDYIAKPLDVDRLISLVRVWMPR